MVGPKCILELFVDGGWRAAASLRIDDAARGMRSPTNLDYEADYLERVSFGGHTDARAVSSRYPTTFETYNDKAWAPFLLDIIPSGAARAFWLRRLNLSLTQEGADWALLVGGAGNPPGNLRVREAAAALPSPNLDHPGFTRDEVIERGLDFVDYAHSRGVVVAGASGAGGDAPKFLLCEDDAERFHTDEVTTRARRWWLVKFPRGSRTVADRLVLEAEAPFMRVAKAFGARAFSLPTWERDCLFVERFDRVRTAKGTVERLGMESLASLAGVAEFGVRIPKRRLAEMIARHTTNAATELREFLVRDILDVALGNSDNHARNTSVLKDADGKIALSPLYDFAPMVLDPAVIARVCTWDDEEDGYPIWGKVVETLAPLHRSVNVRQWKQWLRELGPRVRDLPAVMAHEKVPTEVIDVLRDRILRTARMLEETK